MRQATTVTRGGQRRRGRKPGKRHIEQDLRMRQEGLVTAWEVAEALGVHPSVIHRRIQAGVVPGRSVPASDRYVRWYVDARALLAASSEAPEASRKRLAELCALVRTAS